MDDLMSSRSTALDVLTILPGILRNWSLVIHTLLPICSSTFMSISCLKVSRRIQLKTIYTPQPSGKMRLLATWVRALREGISDLAYRLLPHIRQLGSSLPGVDPL